MIKLNMTVKTMFQLILAIIISEPLAQAGFLCNYNTKTPDLTPVTAAFENNGGFKWIQLLNEYIEVNDTVNGTTCTGSCSLTLDGCLDVNGNEWII